MSTLTGLLLMIASASWAPDADSRALMGYRFHHQVPTDGERIELDGEVAGGGLRLPATRRWYTLDDGRFHGTDRLLSIRPAP